MRFKVQLVNFKLIKTIHKLNKKKELRSTKTKDRKSFIANKLRMIESNPFLIKNYLLQGFLNYHILANNLVYFILSVIIGNNARINPNYPIIKNVPLQIIYRQILLPIKRIFKLFKIRGTYLNHLIFCLPIWELNYYQCFKINKLIINSDNNTITLYSILDIL